ncbi:MAG: hypothetical protein V1816_04670 [Pseudomonadota bacterium]
MKNAVEQMGQEAGPRLRFLLCDVTGDNDNLSSAEEEWVSSPIRCLDLAVDRDPGIVVVRFGRVSIAERETLLELCFALKRNSRAQRRPVLALLFSRHRRLMEELERAKVDYIRYVGEARLDSALAREIIAGLGPEDRPARRLESVCPFPRYSVIDARRELAVCGAYLERMVLGGRRLRELCETEAHLGCECYLHPRPKP